VMKGRMEEAKVAYIKDVVADTQYLYGGVDSPIINQQLGVAGRTAAVFQSWWINYGHAVQKWLTTGDLPADKVGRMLNFTFSSAMVYTAARSMWGHNTAWRTVGLGPFPQPSSGVPMPPAMQPFFQLGGIVVEATKVGFGGDPKVLSQRSKSLLNTSINFLPGGMQTQQTFKAVKKAPSRERTEALIKSLGKFKGWEG